MKKRTIHGAAGLYARSSNTTVSKEARTVAPTKDKNVSARGRENKKVCKRNQGRRVGDIGPGAREKREQESVQKKPGQEGKRH